VAEIKATEKGIKHFMSIFPSGMTSNSTPLLDQPSKETDEKNKQVWRLSQPLLRSLCKSGSFGRAREVFCLLTSRESLASRS